MERSSFQHDGLTLSYLDSGGDGPALVALHAHWMDASGFSGLAEALAPAWRVIALDQRGHGYSDHAASYAREAYVGDVRALFAHLGLAEAALLGNSLGGVNAYQFAARFPAMARGLIIEDIGTEIDVDVSFVLEWEGTFATSEELAERIGPRLLPYLRGSFRSTPQGWRLAFDPHDMVRSQQPLNGDHWGDWLASKCPALVIHGSQSRLTSAEHLEQIARQRPNTRYCELPGGHVLHIDTPELFARTVRDFLQAL